MRNERLIENCGFETFKTNFKYTISVLNWQTIIFRIRPFSNLEHSDLCITVQTRDHMTADDLITHKTWIWNEYSVSASQEFMELALEVAFEVFKKNHSDSFGTSFVNQLAPGVTKLYYLPEEIIFYSKDFVENMLFDYIDNGLDMPQEDYYGIGGLKCNIEKLENKYEYKNPGLAYKDIPDQEIFINKFFSIFEIPNLRIQVPLFERNLTYILPLLPYKHQNNIFSELKKIYETRQKLFNEINEIFNGIEPDLRLLYELN